MSHGALTVIKGLQEAGYSAEVVGGCVRDLLLGYQPKDFDVVTDAEPEKIRVVFPRSRLIGRRFRLAHVRVGREVVEVSTYRGSSDRKSESFEAHTEHGRILIDNVFGTRDDDARRRDFSINALYYDPIEDVLIDYVGGFVDVESRLLRIIGNPERRFEEDPVRMLRAVRFAARLDLEIAEGICPLLQQMGYLLRYVPPARLFDETLKLFQHGYGTRAFEMLREFRLFAELFPDSSKVYSQLDLDSAYGLVLTGLRNTDKRFSDGKPIIAAFLYAVFLWRPVMLELDRNRSYGIPLAQSYHQGSSSVLGRQHKRTTIPRRVATVTADIWNLQRWLEERRPRLVLKILAHQRFRAAYDFLLMRIRAGEVETEIGTWWTRIQEVSGSQKKKMISDLPSQSRKSSGSRRRRRKRI